MIDHNVIKAFRSATISDQDLQKVALVHGLKGVIGSEDLEKVAYLPWLARLGVRAGGTRSAGAAQRYLLRRAARKGRKANIAQRTAATEAGLSPAKIRRSAIAEGRTPVMDAKRVIAKDQQVAANRFAPPSAMESLRMRMPGSGQAGDVMQKLTPRGGHGGPGLGARDMVGRYLQAGPGRRGMVAGGMDLATMLGQGAGRLRSGMRGGLRSARDRVLMGAKRPELMGQRMYAGNREAQLMRGGLATGGAGGMYAMT